ncbi:hypothetical protein WH47_12131 [Habropoda laboriosa]|uniref:Histone-lysine N-methyltransferase SETMAR n=1 Tax=Habropoda laboriosa TaxID=597456 RepID=A0A0L7RAL6_9HYME|nr:hypothetical protein WH47_12131 [Habropoda laboriosa]
MYCNGFSEMYRKLSVIRPTLINRKGPILLHDNTRPNERDVDFVDSRPHSFFIDGVNKLVGRWQRCINCNHFYFE